MVCKTVMKEKKGFKERKSTVFKKAKQLSTLCDVDLLLVFYEPDQPHVPQFWCSKPGGAHELINRYYGEKGAGKVVVKKTDQLNHHHHKEVKRGDTEFIKDLGIQDLKELSAVLEAKIESVSHRINSMRQDKLLSTNYNYSQVTDNGQIEGYNGHNAANDHVVNPGNVTGSDYYHNGNSQVTDAFNFGNFEDDGMNSYDRMWDTGLYDENFNLDDVLLEDYNRQNENAAKVGVVNSGNVADIDCLLDSDDLHDLLMQFEVDDISLDDFEF